MTVAQRDALRDWIAGFNEDALTADGYDEAIIGMAERCSQPTLIVYDAEKIIEILMEQGPMSYEDALEFFNFNISGAWVGEHTPLFMWRRQP
jgi:hypothetical protein